MYEKCKVIIVRDAGVLVLSVAGNTAEKLDEPRQAELDYHWQDYAQVLDLLRNEKPVYLWFKE